MRIEFDEFRLKLEGMEKQLDELAQALGLAALDQEAEENASDYQRLMEIEQKRAALNDEIDGLYLQWEAAGE